jgi:NRPS condensation-like uncharacterized protein
MDRKLGDNERITWLYQQLRPMHFAIVATINGKIGAKELRQALEKTQHRHPLLNVKVTLDESKIPWFKKNSVQIPIRIIERIHAEQWKRVVEQELKNPFDPNEPPLIRISLVEGGNICELIITCDHTIADGKSIVFLLKDILQYLGTPDQPVIQLPPRNSYEEILFQRKSDGTAYSETLSQTKTRPKIPENSCPSICTWLLTEWETATIIEGCKKERVTVHAGICAAFLLSMADSQARKNLKCLSPVDIRGLFSEINDDFGYYFTAVNTEHSITPDLSIWDLAHSVKSQINEKIAPSNFFARLPELEAFLSTSPSHKEAVEMMDAVNEHDFLISNLGKLDIPEEYGKLKLVAIYGPSLMSHVDRDLIVGVMTFRDRMSLTITYSESFFTKSEIRQLQEKAMELLGVGYSQRSLVS